MDNRPPSALNAAPMSDRALIESLTRAVLADDATAIEPHFTEGRIAAPSFSWNPEPTMLGEAPLKVLHKWWHAQRPARGLPSIDAVDPIALKDALAHAR